MTQEDLDFPFGIGKDGRIATTGEDDHIRHLIEQVLFTNPGERVNLPEFGCGLRSIIFAPNSDLLATTTRLSVSVALQRWLGHIIRVDSVEVGAEEEKLMITIVYTKLRTLEEGEVRFIR